VVYIASSPVMIDGEGYIVKDLEEHGPGLIGALSGLLPGAHENPYKAAGDPAEIRTEHLPNTTLERYRQLTPPLF
jgi:hypothetical protein